MGITYTLEGFMTVQEGCLSRAQEGLERLRQQVAAVIVTACKVSGQQSLTIQYVLCFEVVAGALKQCQLNTAQQTLPCLSD